MKIKIKALWNVLMGRPVIYRVNFTDGIVLLQNNKNAYVAGCWFKNFVPIK